MNILRRLLGVMMLGSAIWLATLLLPHLGFASQSTAKESVNWQPLSEQAIEDALAQHKRVVVDVTADWCITCKVNKFNVLQKEDVQTALQQPDVVALRGDWTLPSEAITEFLKKRGQVAVPFNQIYGPGLPQGHIADVVNPRCAAEYTGRCQRSEPMKMMIVLLLTLFSAVSVAKEPAPFTPEQEKQIEALIQEALFNDPNSPRIGAKQAKLTLINFTDYNCPYCKQLDPMLEKIVQKYPDVAVVIKPLPFKGESSVLSARTALTTWREHPQQFLALHEKLMQKKGYHTAVSIKQAQEKAAASPVTLDAQSEETLSTNLQLARLVGVRGTPATIIGDELIPGAVPWETLEEVVKEKLAAANGQ